MAGLLRRASQVAAQTPLPCDVGVNVSDPHPDDINGRAALGGRGIVVLTKAATHAAPDSQSEPLIVADHDRAAELLDCRNDWLRIRVGKAVLGWTKDVCLDGVTTWA
jgi:hypothetical protein